jgi:hypothetical protein
VSARVEKQEDSLDTGGGSVVAKAYRRKRSII